MSREKLVAAVLAEGLDTFSMPSLGRRLGVAHSGLYRYVESREELLTLTLDHIVRDASWPATDLPWRDQLASLGETTWALCDQYRGYAAASLTVERVPTAFAATSTEHAHALASRGLQLEDAFAAIEFVTTLALAGSLSAARVRTESALVSSEVDYPQRWAERGWYERQLDVYLDGLERKF
jgi:AcrR family transcriptional regulator